MKSRFKISGKLMVAALLVSILALPAVGGTQATGSNASLADTLTWLTSFLPTATGAAASTGNGQVTSSIKVVNGCSVSIYTENSRSSSANFTLTFSLSDIDPSSISVRAISGGVFEVFLATRGGALLVKMQGSTFADSYGSAGVNYFADQASAQRVANAFQHAAQLCANASPF
jgi:hypothetical protein